MHTADFRSVDLTGARCCQDFQLMGHDGRTRTLADFRGKVVVMVFGYTHCSDVCPTTLAEMNGVLRQLGADASRVQVLFVTLDPERDTPHLLSQYVPAFNERFLALYGDARTIAATAKEFRVFYRKQPGSASGTYSIDHTASSFVFDTQGRIRLFVPYGQETESLVADIRVLLE